MEHSDRLHYGAAKCRLLSTCHTHAHTHTHRHTHTHTEPFVVWCYFPGGLAVSSCYLRLLQLELRWQQNNQNLKKDKEEKEEEKEQEEETENSLISNKS